MWVRRNVRRNYACTRTFLESWGTCMDVIIFAFLLCSAVTADRIKAQLIDAVKLIALSIERHH